MILKNTWKIQMVKGTTHLYLDKDFMHLLGVLLSQDILPSLWIMTRSQGPFVGAHKYQSHTFTTAWSAPVNTQRLLTHLHTTLNYVLIWKLVVSILTTKYNMNGWSSAGVQSIKLDQKYLTSKTTMKVNTIILDPIMSLITLKNFALIMRIVN